MGPFAVPGMISCIVTGQNRLPYRTLARMRHRLARIAAGSFALALVLFGTVLARAVGNGVNPDPDVPALAASFAAPSWALTAATVSLPLLALAGSVVLTWPRRKR